MKTRTALFLIIFFMLSGVSSSAQIGSALRNKLNKAINKDVQNKADSAAKDQPVENRRGLGGLLGGKTDINHNDEYDFTGRIYMVMESYDKKDVTKSDFYTYFNTNTLNAGIEVKVTNSEKGETPMATQFIFDNDNRCFMMLVRNEDSRTGIISTIPDDSTMNAQVKNQKPDEKKQAVITKTGNSKMIAGYKCEEYKIVEEGEDGYSNVWMTKDVKIKADKRNWGKAGMPNYYGYAGFENSMMLAMEGYDKNNKLTMKMETIEINENFKHSISTVGFSFIKMNFGQAGRK
ncbi:MAG TPA: hypothetical protein DEO60_02295 [Bacteroidales bacterium]|nr:hypothetical protein [Bacteroidales bacterium]HBZ19933.1 hypothetical protein [Bacteroidales bacterium]